jgi:hypothetical protein
MRYLGLVLLLVLAGCGGQVDDSQELPIRQPHEPAAEWKSFPVGQTPRPIVLIDELPTMAGFSTGDAKIAALSRNYTLETPLPTDSGPGLVSAKLAYEGLTRNRRPDRSPPLSISKVELGTAQFNTDRGRASLPAWLFHARDSLGPIAWPADEPAKFWRLGEVRPAVTTNVAKMNGTKLTVMLPAPRPPCPGDAPVHNEPTVLDAATTVMIGVRTEGTPGTGNCVQDASLRMASYDITLPTPLGDRVLLGADGGVVAVVPS